MIYLYENHHGNLYLSDDMCADTYCEICGDSNTLIERIDNSVRSLETFSMMRTSMMREQHILVWECMTLKIGTMTMMENHLSETGKRKEL